MIYTKNGMYDDALKFYQENLEISKKVSDKQGMFPQ
ncbi:MAG TPA: tetratricopeptide repeat protein [Nitrososphaeraceae archaeon]